MYCVLCELHTGKNVTNAGSIHHGVTHRVTSLLHNTDSVQYLTRVYLSYNCWFRETIKYKKSKDAVLHVRSMFRITAILLFFVVLFECYTYMLGADAFNVLLLATCP